MHHLKKLRSELGDIHSVLVAIHKNPIASTSLGQWYTISLHYKYNILIHKFIHSPEKKVEELLTLEAKYGPISGYESAINDVLNYLSEVLALYRFTLSIMGTIDFKKTTYIPTVN